MDRAGDSPLYREAPTTDRLNCWHLSRYLNTVRLGVNHVAISRRTDPPPQKSQDLV